MLAQARSEQPQQKAVPPPARRRSRVTSRPPVRGVRVGQRVQYRQGRGTFTAKVVRINDKNGTAVLERATDKKRVERPLAKVYAGAARRGPAKSPRRAR